MTDDPRARVLITAEALAASLGSVAILAIGAPPGAARIPGAVGVDVATELASPGGGTAGNRPLPDIAALQAAARSWGLRQGAPVVVYDHDRGLQAARAWWVLRWAGVADVRLLDGGFAAWRGPVATEAPSPAPGDVVLSAGHLPVLDADATAAMPAAGVLLDTRIRPSYIAGHIPGAIASPAPDHLTEAGAFADATTLRHLFAAHGIDGARPVGISCGSGMSAAHGVLALASIGISAAMFPGSWSAWSADPARPRKIGGV